jgi:uncharacterized membrane protein
MILLPTAVPLLLLLLALLLVVFVVLVKLRVLSYAYQKIGVRPRDVFLIMVLTNHTRSAVDRMIAATVDEMYSLDRDKRFIE